ncbi:PAS domain S-box protein [Candidatus Poribacteria bacterium]|nr:PAS domain S-box protein [Candidatus Poribacteria bacterium]
MNTYEQFHRCHRGFLEFVHPDDQEATIAIAQKLTTEGGSTVSFENRYLCKDGSYKWLSWNSTVSLEKQLYYAVARDITERKQAEDALRESAQRFRQLAENIREVFWLTSPDKNQVIYISPGYEELWGRTSESLYEHPRSFLDAIHPEDRERVTAAQSKQIRGEYDEAYRIVRPDGSIRWVRSRAFPIRNEFGAVYRIAGISDDITRHKQAEEALVQERDLLNSLMDNIPDSIYFKDANSRFIRINKALAVRFGLSAPSGAVGKTDFDFFTQEHAQQAYADEQKVIRTGQPLLGKEEKETWHDRVTYASTTKVPLRDKDGKIIGTFGISRDITEHELAEAALRESEDRLRRAVHDAPFPIMLHAEDGEVLLISKAWTELTGYTHDDIPTISDWTERAYGQRKNLVQADIDGLYNLNERKKEGAYVITTSSGETRTWDFSSAPLGQLPDGRRLVISMAMDVTDRVRAEETLAAKEKLYRTLIESIPHVIWLGKADGNVTYQNKAYEDLTGRPLTETLGFGWAADLHPDDKEELLKKYEDAYKRGKDYRGECRFRAKDGSYKTVYYIGTPVLDDSGKIINWVGINMDITERVQAEAELQGAKEDAEYANRAKSEFLANMSHELRTPLNAIIGFAEILRDELLGPINDEQKDLIVDIHTSGRHLLVMINDILDLSKIEAGKMELQLELFSVVEAVEEVNTVIRAIANKKQIELSLEFDQDVSIEADKVKFKQMLYNLLSNAVKFTSEGGHVTTKFGIFEDELIVQVIDTGVGIKLEDQNKLFQAFTQLDASKSREHKGTGLGLALTKRLVELHEGKIWVESEYRKGSTFLFRLPLRQQTAVPEVHQQAPHTSVVPPPLSSNRTILIAEDDEHASQLLGFYLTEAGYQVEYARDGEEAIAKAAEIQPFAMTLDVMLPKKDGWQVLKALKTSPNLQSIPVIIVSVTEDRQLAFGLGAMDHLVKPIDKEALLASLRSLRFSAQERAPRILVVDDDPRTVRLLYTVLTNAGYEVLKAYGGQEAIDLALSQAPDLMILDLMMPQVDGFTVIRRLSREPQTRDIPIIICTAMDLTDEERERLNGQIQSIIQKTGHVKEELLEAIKRIERFRKPSVSSPHPKIETTDEKGDLHS